MILPKIVNDEINRKIAEEKRKKEEKHQLTIFDELGV